MTSNLKIRPITFKLNSEEESLRNITPVFKVLIGSSAETVTMGKKDQGSITWEEELDITRFPGKTVHIEIWDPDHKTLIGRGEKSFDSLNISTGEWIPLLDSINQVIGQVLVEIEGTPEETDIEVGDQMEGIPKHMLPHESYFDLHSKLDKFLRPDEKKQDLHFKATYYNYFYSTS